MMPRKKRPWDLIQSGKFDWKITVWKVIKSALVYGIPYLIFYLQNYNPAILSLTIGSILIAVLNWLKNGTSLTFFKKI